MSRQQILEKAIRKAIEGGYPGDISDYKTDGFTIYRWAGKSFMEFDASSFIFSHPFAEALWGDEPYMDKVDGNDEYLGYRAWEHHLREMVIADDPIQYLGNNI